MNDSNGDVEGTSYILDESSNKEIMYIPSCLTDDYERWRWHQENFKILNQMEKVPFLKPCPVHLI